MAYSADRKPGELTALTTLATDDVFVVGDTSDASEVAKGITKANLITDLNASLTPALSTTVTTNANLTGHVTSVGNAAVLGSFTKTQLTAAVSDGDPLYVGDISGISDGDKGDITVSASGATWTIDNGAVTLAKQADMATASVVYRKTAGTGVPEVNTLATLKTDLGLTGTNSGDQTTIAGITGTKAQFDTAVSDGNIMFDGDSITNAVATADRVFYSNNSGVITELALGADGTFLKSNGATAAPSFATPAGSGDVTKVGTPVNNQVGVWTGDGTIEGDAALTYNSGTTTFNTPLTVNSSVANQASLTTFVSNAGSALAPRLQVIEPSTATAGIGFARFSNGATAAPRFSICKSNGNTIGDYTIVASGDNIGDITFGGADGVDFAAAASISAFVDGTPGSNDMPGRLVFYTTPDGSGTPTARLILDSAGALKPATNDGVPLGNTINQFSDLFLAEGGVINWDNGDATLTQTGNVLALAGADLQVATAGVGTNADSIPTLSSTSTLTNKTLTAPTLTGTTVADRFDYDRAIGAVNAIGNLGATETIDWSTHTHYTGTLDSNITFTFSNPVSGEVKTLYLSYDSTAQRTITWPTITWMDNATGAAPTTPAASGKVLVVTLVYIGSTYYGSATGNYAVYA